MKTRSLPQVSEKALEVQECETEIARIRAGFANGKYAPVKIQKWRKSGSVVGSIHCTNSGKGFELKQPGRPRRNLISKGLDLITKRPGSRPPTKVS